MAEIRLPIVANFDVDDQNIINVGLATADSHAIRRDYIEAQLTTASIPAFYNNGTADDSPTVVTADFLRIGNTVYNLSADHEPISAATDVTISSVQDDQILRYDSGSSMWVNVDFPATLSSNNLTVDGTSVQVIDGGTVLTQPRRGITTNNTIVVGPNQLVRSNTGKLWLNISGANQTETNDYLFGDDSQDPQHWLEIDSSMGDAYQVHDSTSTTPTYAIPGSMVNAGGVIYVNPTANPIRIDGNNFNTNVSMFTEISDTNLDDLGSLDDVVLTSAAQYQVLTFNGTDWVNGAVNLSQSAAITGDLPTGNIAGVDTSSGSQTNFLDARGAFRSIALADLSNVTGVPVTDQVLTGVSGGGAQFQLPTISVQEEAMTGFRVDNLRFVGASVTATHDSGNNTALITITGGGAAMANVSVSGESSLSYADRSTSTDSTANTLEFTFSITPSDGFNWQGDVTQTALPGTTTFTDTDDSDVTLMWANSTIDNTATGDSARSITFRSPQRFIGIANGSYSFSATLRPDGAADASEDQTVTFSIRPDVYQPTYHARFSTNRTTYIPTTMIAGATPVPGSLQEIDMRLQRRTDITFPVATDGTNEYFALWIPFEFHGATDPIFFAGGFQITPLPMNIIPGTGTELGRYHGGYVMYVFEYRHTVNFEIRN